MATIGTQFWCSVSEEIFPQIGRKGVMARVIEDHGDWLVVFSQFNNKQYKAIVHTANDGLHWSEIVEEWK